MNITTRKNKARVKSMRNLPGMKLSGCEINLKLGVEMGKKGGDIR